jgi:small nuclear ribonucleoprotein (snRNP)-like protein
MSGFFYKFFSELADRSPFVTVELKNNVEVEGKLKHVDGNLNLCLEDTTS